MQISNPDVNSPGCSFTTDPHVCDSSKSEGSLTNAPPTSIQEGERPEPGPSLINVSSAAVPAMFKRPQPEILKHFFKFHPIQDIDPLYKEFDERKTFFRSDGTRRQWLSYCKETKALHCSICLAFSRCADESNKFITGMTDLKVKHLYTRINEHESSKQHVDAVEAYMMNTENKSIEVMLFEKQLSMRRKRVEELRTVFERIVDVIKLIGKRGLSSRGAYEAAKDLDKPNISHGNFLDLLLFLSKYDAPLCAHIQSVIQAAKTRSDSGQRSQFRTLLSKNTANIVIKSIATLIKRRISNEIEKAGMYSIQIDTAQDVSVLDICSVVLRYIDIHCETDNEVTVQERVLSILNPKKSTGEGLCDLVSKNLEENDIAVTKCIGCSTDGAANMKGQYNGFVAWLQKKTPKSLVYIWCYAHRLNLVMMDTTSICTAAVSLWGLLNELAVFLRDSYKRMDVWRDVTKDARVLNLIGETRWWAKDSAIKKVFGSFKDPRNSLYAVIMTAFTIIHSNPQEFSGKARSTARNLMHSLLTYETIITAQLFLKIFQNTTPLSKYLQTKGMHFFRAQQMVDATRKTLEKESRNRNLDDVVQGAKIFVDWVNSELQELFDDGKIIDEIILQDDFPEIRRVRKKKKLAGEETNDSYIPSTPLSNFEINVHNVAFDTVLTQLQTRFSDNAELFADISCLDPRNFTEELPAKALHELSRCIGLENETELKNELIDFRAKWNNLKMDLPDYYEKFTDIDPEDVDVEVVTDDERNMNEQEGEMVEVEEKSHSGKKRCRNCITCCFNVLKKYRLYAVSYNNLFKAYQYILTLSCTQVGCETTFSALSYIKNKLRNRLNMENLDAWMIMFLNKDILENLTFKEILDEVVSINPTLKKVLLE